MTRFRKYAWAARTALLFGAENAFAGTTPRLYSRALRLLKAHGRSDGQSGEAGAHYFRSVADDYETMAQVAGITSGSDGLFASRTILELGPGDTKALGLIALLRGAASYHGSDAFDIQSRDRSYLDGIYGPILRDEGNTMGLQEAHGKLAKCKVLASPRSEHGSRVPYDLVVSRAVLEHVSDLDALFDDLRAVTTPDAVLIHKVDLRSHGIERDNPLDFLMFPPLVYKAMSSKLGRPNRVRADDYLRLGPRHGFQTIYAAATRSIDKRLVQEARPFLSRPFRNLSNDNLSTIGLWLVQVGDAHPLAKRVTAPLDASRLDAAPFEKLSAY